MSEKTEAASPEGDNTLDVPEINGKDKKRKSVKEDKKKDGGEDEKDPDRFTYGVLLRGKLIGVEDVKEEAGDELCQISMIKLKAVVLAKKEHKQRICIKINLDGLEILDEKTNESLYKHAVNKISYIARDVNDARAIGYIYKNKSDFQYFAIKTERAAQEFFNTLKELFEVVLEIRQGRRAKPVIPGVTKAQEKEVTIAEEEQSTDSILGKYDNENKQQEEEETTKQEEPSGLLDIDTGLADLSVSNSAVPDVVVSESEVSIGGPQFSLDEPSSSAAGAEEGDSKDVLKDELNDLFAGSSTDVDSAGPKQIILDNQALSGLYANASGSAPRLPPMPPGQGGQFYQPGAANANYGVAGLNFSGSVGAPAGSGPVPLYQPQQQQQSQMAFYSNPVGSPVNFPAGNTPTQNPFFVGGTPTTPNIPPPTNNGNGPLF